MSLDPVNTTGNGLARNQKPSHPEGEPDKREIQFAMALPEPNYFTCTLGEAALEGRHTNSGAPSFTSILDVIDQQAESSPSSLAVGFSGFAEKRDSAESPSSGPLTFKDLRDLSVAAARTLEASIHSKANERSAVGLLCGSSLDFVLTFLGLMRLAYPVILLAPQLGSQAIEHLCHRLGARILIHDDRHESTASKIGNGIQAVQVPSYTIESQPDHSRSSSASAVASVDLAEPAFYFHTSGTSSGLPSPIPQSHAMVKALPRFQKPNQPATFSTTPLYHGGVADCLRAWTSGAMIWCFPENECPLTAHNITLAVNSAFQKSSVPVKYFSSVPYVLQMLAEDEHGLQLLASMDLVGVGGSAMPIATGDLLVKSGVNLLSRYGSAECGFLLSSHRAYSEDKEWEYLLVGVNTNLLRFAGRENGLWELIVQPGWPFRSKTNREDGSYATADLFEPHPLLKNAWRYHSRADSLITLANGKKFDPLPVERELQSATPLLRDAYVFGTGKPCAGALLFPSPGATSNYVLAAVQPVLSRFNSKGPGHARVEESMLIVMPNLEEDDFLPKSSKGSVLRHQADAKYKTVIEAAYEASPASPDASTSHVQDFDLLSVVSDCFHRILRRSIDPDKDLYQQGVDSIACIQIRKLLEAKNLVKCAIPLNVIYDQGTVTGLVSYFRRICNAQLHGVQDVENQLEHMKSLVSQYRLSPGLSRSSRSKLRPNVVLLTGATGFLGAYLLGLLLRRHDVSKIYCLVRASTKEEARDRVSQCQVQRGFSALPLGNNQDDASHHIICLPFATSKSHLSLAADDRQAIIQEATLILHASWPVNFTLPLSSFEDQFSCLSELLALAVASDAHVCLISSVAAASSTNEPRIAESISTDPSHAVSLGYARSKWVAEGICSEANQMLVKTSGKAIASVIRIGQLCGDSKTGAWNCSEAYPLMFSASSAVGCLPDLPHEGTNWLPVDIAARAVLEISLPEHEKNLDGTSRPRVDEMSSVTPPLSSAPVYHVANPHVSTSWHQMLRWITDAKSQLGTPHDLDVVSPGEWVARLERNLDEDHPARGLLNFWKQLFSKHPAGNDGDDAVGRQELLDKDDKERQKLPILEVIHAYQAAESMGEVAPLDRETVLRLWSWSQANVRPLPHKAA